MNMINKMKRKPILKGRRGRQGFSLAEALVAVLILLMVSAIVAAGMPMAREVYEKTVDAANAHTLLSTTATMLRSELSQSRYVSGGDGAPLVYRSGRTGMTTTLSRPESGDGVTAPYSRGPFLTYDINGDGDIGENEKWYLVTTQATTKRLITDFTEITYSDGIYTVSGLCVTREGTGTIAELSTLEIRTVNHD